MTSGTEPIAAGGDESEPCPRCGMDLSPGVHYCEHCGVARTAASAHLEVTVDEAWFRQHDTVGVAFPAARPIVRVALGPDGVTIGRRRPGEQAPDLDLSGSLGDPAVSHVHAAIEPGGAGGWRIVDAGSANGTVVDGWGPLADGDAVALHDGSRIHIGAWTTLIVRAARSADAG